MGLVNRRERIFVGRQREMAELRGALDDAMAGQGRSVMLAGEPGIGKTRTAQELGSHAAALGVKVLWGWCYEREGAPPYWPWIQPMRSYIQEKDSAELRSQMGPGASDIAQIVPEVRQQLPDMEPSPILEPQQARFRLFDSITNFLKNAAQSQPLMLVLEDLHWADHSSLMLWEFVSKEISNARVMLLGTYRDVEVGRGHPLSQALGALIREPSFRRVQLGGLSKQDASRLVELSAGVTLAEPSLDLIHSRTEGNPLFLSELVRLVGEENIGAGDSWTSALPEGIKDIIGRRLDRLSQRCNETLTVASVIGREFSLEQLKPLIDGLPEDSRTEDALLQVLEEAQSARVIEESPGSRDRFRFSHALIQETVASELTTARRVRLHARIAEALEQLYGADAEAHAAELAHHFAEAEAISGGEKLVRYSQLAGEQALAAYAWAEALDHYQLALETKGVRLSGGEPAKDDETAELLFGLGRAQAGVFPLYRIPEAIATLSRAFNYYADVADVDRALAVALSPILGIGIGRRSGRAQMIERALKLMPPNFREEGRLLSDYGVALGIHEGNYDGAQEALNRALEIARRAGDATLEMRTLCHAARVDQHQGRMREALENSLLALELAPRANDLAAESDAHSQASNQLMSLGEPEAARYHLSAMSAPAAKAADYFSTFAVLVNHMKLSSLVGDWVAAREFGDRALAAGPFDARLLLRRIMLEYQEGDFVQGRVYVDRLQEVMHITSPGPTLDTVCFAMAVSLAARITGSAEQLEVGKTAAEAALASPYATRSVRMAATCTQGIWSVLTGDAVAAAGHYTALEGDSGYVLTDSNVMVDHLLGLLSHTMGKLDAAAVHFEDALAFCRRAGYRPDIAWTCHDYADTLLQRNGPGDKSSATALLDESLAISTELGMRPLMARVNALQVRAETQRAGGPVYPNGLTPREVEVLRLVASGKTSAEIAADLVLSRRTVERHISNIYSKTEVRSRAEATAFAFTHGLTSSS
ncbi:MAG: AAA family ATPase [Chloroflexi bacterium]|nr:AAA family ATPase [Chloroflexota bacterium]